MGSPPVVAQAGPSAPRSGEQARTPRARQAVVRKKRKAKEIEEESGGEIGKERSIKVLSFLLRGCYLYSCVMCSTESEARLQLIQHHFRQSVCYNLVRNIFFLLLLESPQIYSCVFMALASCILRSIPSCGFRLVPVFNLECMS